MKIYSKDPVFFSEVREDLQKDPSTVGVVHLSHWADAESEVKNRWIVVEDSLEPKDIVTQVYSKQIKHLVQKNEKQFLGDLKRAGILVEKPNQYFQADHLMVEAQGVVTKRICFNGRQKKNVLLAEAYAFVEQTNCGPTIEAGIAAIEELYMNAVVDAPKEAERFGYLTPDDTCEFFLALNQETLQISCSDPFGSLDLKRLFTRLYDVYQKGAAEAIDLQGPGGAGIGCYLLFEQCRTLIFGVKRGVQTKVTCLIPRAASRRKFDNFKKSLHGFEVES